MITIRLVQTQDRNLNQLQQNIKQAVESPFAELADQFTVSVSGFTAAQTGVMYWQTGTTQNAVTLKLPNINSGSNSTEMVISTLPTNLYPMTQQICLVPVIDGGVISIGYAIVNTDGTITLNKNVSFAPFTASGSKGIIPATISYIRSM